jgi:LmbE family N-acetylglucosaminyl deacetylase
MRARTPFIALCIVFLTACVAPPRAPHVPDVARPRVLAVIAHPDDETVFAASLYAVSRELGGVCDVVVITNGEGGFKYSTLAESLYHAELTREEIGRARLPAIRKAEMTAACELLGVRRLRFLDQLDHRYTTDEGEVLGAGAAVWDLGLVRERLGALLAADDYDFLFCMLPTDGTHAHHKSATILALEAAAALPAGRRPVVLGATVEDEDETATAAVEGLAGWPVTRLRSDRRAGVFDRRRPFGHRERLDWRIVVDWAIAEHKSQGTLQMMAGRGAREVFFCFDVGPADAPARAAELFERLAAVTFAVPDYDASAGTNAAK